MPNSRPEASTAQLDAAVEEQLSASVERLLQPAATLFAVQKVEGENVRDKSKRAYGRMEEAHLLLVGVLASAIERAGGKVVAATKTSEQRDALFAAFVIGMDLCERAIEEGRYLQALALLRQEMEVIAQLKTVALGKNREGRQSKVTVLDESLRRLYDELSAAAHASRHHLLRSATKLGVTSTEEPEDTLLTRYYPAFERDMARRCFSLHLMLLLRLIEEMSTDYYEQRPVEDRFQQQDADALNLVISLMVAEEMFESYDEE